jgi:hypothetical protein
MNTTDILNLWQGAVVKATTADGTWLRGHLLAFDDIMLAIDEPAVGVVLVSRALIARLSLADRDIQDSQTRAALQGKP